MKLRALAFLVGGLALLGGCANLAPPYQRPAPALPAPGAPVPAADPSALGREAFFTDERLRATVELALANNRDLRVAALNVQRARAQARLTDAAQLPNVSANAGASRANSIGTSYSAGLSLAAFELDLFGRLRNESEAALQTWLASEAGRTSTEISLVAETANAWLSLAADLANQGLAQQTFESRGRSLELDQRRHALGAISGLALAQSQSLVDSARLDIATAATQVEQDRNALELLLGTALPPALAPDSAQNLAEASRLVELPAGVPSELLQRRPDVLQAERQLQASVANIGVARAAFFPRISLTAMAGTASSELSGLFKAGSRTWSYGPSLSLPIFDGGANAANLESAKLDREIALAQYDKAVQTAFREVADALAVRARLAERLAAQQALVATAERQLALADAQHRAGSTGMLEVLDAERSLYAAQQSLIALRLTEQANRLELYKVLGGGWKKA
ncbi:efflux transporter outer membrane subunit [Paucibacter sp. R3-3]|uniref:Efflux transporter outer membrane subunit n=1 Tax=Roseateles agri TaxID=3098619 RepID=A0ABU5DDN0_9BURK|nr:efflux transporter outer membrane subunit [Paucibacter sp. R3-3]MDY0744392.1 efflux transporter outer membrane subunit [Paucibacter sp. R3-3]